MQGLSNYEEEFRPWGSFERFTLNESSTVKLITVKAGEAFSLQTHAHRAEFWRVMSGSGSITAGEQVREAHPGDSFFVPQGAAHRAEAGSEDLVLLEISLGAFDETDIVRLKDKYGRA